VLTVHTPAKVAGRTAAATEARGAPPAGRESRQ